MASAELKENGKRVRHCFPRLEVYHRWIHDDTYVYSRQSYRISGKYDWLFAFNINKNADRDTITYGWKHAYDNNARNCIAVINRDIKAILVNVTFFKRSNELIYSIPDDYQIFLTDETIDNPNIFSTGEVAEAVKIHAKYITKEFANQRLCEYYCLLQGKKRVVHNNINNTFKRTAYTKRSKYCYKLVDYDTVYDFVKKYKVKDYDWYNTPLYNELDIRYDVNWSSYYYIKAKCPSIKQIITNKVFSNKEKLKLEQSYFYDWHCIGCGISFKDVQLHWNDEYDEKVFRKLYAKHNIKYDYNSKTDLKTWKDGVKDFVKSLRTTIQKVIDNHKAESINNYNKAVDKYNNVEYGERLKDWREFSYRKHSVPYIEYDKFVVTSSRFGTGHWIKEKIHPLIQFNNVQLRVRTDEHHPDYNVVQTSKNATVMLFQAIDMYRLYKITIAKDNPEVGKIIKHNFTDKNIKVGIYNLRAIEFRQKQTDYGNLLNKWEYVVVIGCHHIWIDDFIDFVKYYKLEDKFGIN